MFVKPLNILFLFLMFSQVIFAQDKCPTKFEKIKPTDFTDKYPEVDSTAGAIIIADVGESSFETNNKEWFSLIFKRFTRIRINNSSAYDLATVSIPLYSNNDNDEEKIKKIEAYTYNLENGEIVKQKLKKEDIIKDKSRKGLVIQKFTMPNVKVGSIIEYEYTMQSDFLFNLQSWTFQGKYPCVWSEYEVAIPAFFMYTSILNGHLPFDVEKVTSETSSYSVKYTPKVIADAYLKKTKTATYNTNDNIYKWVVKNAPTIKNEKFTTSLQNHIQNIQFQYTGLQFPNSTYQAGIDDWATACNKLMNASNFGDDIYRRNSWIESLIKTEVVDCKTPLEKAKKIFNYIKNNYKCDNEAFGYELTTNLKDVGKKKQGSIADINLLLAAMLDFENINVKLVMLSTTWHGKAYPFLPIMNNYNYVICDVIIDKNHYYLDGSSPINGFAKLSAECYNGFAVSIDKDNHNPFSLSADSLMEVKSTVINININDKDTTQWQGTVNSNLGYFESMGIRQLVHKKSEEEAKKLIYNEYSFPFKAFNVEFSQLTNYEEAATLKYNFTSENEGSKNVIYLNPLIKEGTVINNFKSDDRNYPVEMPYKTDENILVIIQIPEGYALDEKPQDLKVKMPSDKAYFNYTVGETSDVITIVSRIKFNQANFSIDDYPDLQAFMDFVVRKHSEQLVFKKK